MNVKAPTKRFFVWDTYWDTGRLQSFDLEGKPGAVAALGQYWASVNQFLPPGAAVADIGCGHGAAAVALLTTATGSAPTLTAIDEANIDPLRYLPGHKAILERIDFRPRVQMEALPFESQSLDAVISQFGLEFGPLPKTANEIARVLKPGGILAALVLPYNSEAVQDARRALRQCRYLLTEAKLFDSVLAAMQVYYQAPADTAEQQVQAGMDAFRKDVEQAFSRFNEKEINVLSVIVNALYHVFANRKTASEQDQVFAIENARTHLAHFAARAQDTVRSAVDINMAQLRGALTAAGIQVGEIRSMQAPGYNGLVAYQLFGRRIAPAPQPAAAG